jgi:16S rRNA (cytosine967-C5)-methyltransferase
MRLDGQDPAALLTGQGHAPPPPAAGEAGRVLASAPEAVRLDLPDWLVPAFRRALGDGLGAGAEALRGRAPVTLRANLLRASRDAAAAALAAEGVATAPHPEVATALIVTAGAARLRATAAWAEGLVELQDASSQAAVLRLPLADGMRVLDLCAGGGGKALAMAALARLEIVAHDADPARMADLGPRARRAGARIATLAPLDLDRAGRFDLVLVDAPCSGSGAWRRSPAGKWRLTPAQLAELLALQDRLLDRAAALALPAGRLAYATCSVLLEENEERVAAFLARGSGWRVADRLRLAPGPLADGFAQAILCRA